MGFELMEENWRYMQNEALAFSFHRPPPVPTQQDTRLRPWGPVTFKPGVRQSMRQRLQGVTSKNEGKYIHIIRMGAQREGPGRGE